MDEQSQETQPAAEMPSWLTVLLVGSVVATVAGLIVHFLFGGDYAVWVGAAGCLLILFDKDAGPWEKLAAIAWYAAVFALMVTFLPKVF
jgi:hypothetical protein